MRIVAVDDREKRRAFHSLPREVYKGNPLQRFTETAIERLLILGPTAFHSHADVKPFLIEEEGRFVGRFALIHDRKLPDHVQVAFFEALPGLTGVAPALLEGACRFHPTATRIVVGLNGHVNYGAGILLDRFDEPPLFGLPYSPPYYARYFEELTPLPMVSFRYPMEPFYAFYDAHRDRPIPRNIRVRTMDRRRLMRDVGIYTELNNACFGEMPLWSERTVQEDYELFHPFRHLLKDEDLVFAYSGDKPIGFLLWYPDFNQLARPNETLGLRHVLRYRLPGWARLTRVTALDTFRLAEIAVLPGFQASGATLAMILAIIPPARRLGLRFGEGGFIFEENRPSMTMTRRFLERAVGRPLPPHRRYAVFEGDLR